MTTGVLGFKEKLHLGIGSGQFDTAELRRADAACLRRGARRVLPKAARLGVLEFELLRFAKELDVLLVGAGPAALDVVHAERVEALRDAEFVGE